MRGACAATPTAYDRSSPKPAAAASGVFGSVATGQDGPDSDVDLLFTMGGPLSLMELGRLEQRLAAAIGIPVDLVPDSAIRPDLRSGRILAEAVPL